jgi:hypothetical protein
MQEERSLIKQLFNNYLSYEVIVSEDEGSKPRSSFTQCKKWSKECDVFIAIIGNNYGFTINKLGISVSEMEFNEAYKDNPEKILIYISAGNKDLQQTKFVERVEDFNEGYFRRKPFDNETELINGIKEDLAAFIKERLDLIRRKKIRVRQRTTPVELDYVTSQLGERGKHMNIDAKDVFETLGFTYLQEFERLYRLPGILMCKRKIGKIDVLFNFWILPQNLDSHYLRSYTSAYQKYVRHSDFYDKYKNRFAIHLVHGKGTLRTLEGHFYNFGATCFNVEPGIYCGPGFRKNLSLEHEAFFENMLLLFNIENKQSMVSKLSDALSWLQEEQDKIDFQCNVIRPIKVKLKKYKKTTV